MKTTLTEVMKHKENPLTGDWLCWIPGTAQAYYYSTKRTAKRFCDKINNAFAIGQLEIIEGKLIKH